MCTKLYTDFQLKHYSEHILDLADTHSIELGFDIQEAVTQRLAQRNKKTVQLNDLMTSTKFTKQEICTMYRGFKQVRTYGDNN